MPFMSELQEARHNDVLILGAGVIGLACAHYLLKAGRGVTVIDQGAIGSGASHGNCGTITPSHAPPLAVPGTVKKALRWMLTRDAPLYVKPRLDFELLGWLLRFAHRCNAADAQRATRQRSAILNASRQWLAELIDGEKLACEFEQRGTLYAYRSEAAIEHDEEHVRALADVGIATRHLGGAEVRLREPALRDEVIGGLLHPGDAQLRPDRLVAELARRVREQGGVIVENCRIDGFARAKGRIAHVATTQGEFTADEIVMALGAWSPLLAHRLDLRLPIQPGKGYSITFTRPALCPTTPLVLRERSVCVTAWDSGFRLGSTMEFSGYDASLNRVRLDALKRGAAEYLREPLGAEVTEEWFGWRPMTYDDLPILGRAPGIANLMLATGHGMLGVTMSAATGVLISELVCGKSPSLDPTPYRPERLDL
jgi:D-amino-acid dehydrogenase